MSEVVDFPKENKRSKLVELARKLISSSPEDRKKPSVICVVFGIGNIVKIGK